MKFQKPRGTRDIYGIDLVIYNNIVNILQQCVTKYHYQQFITPIFEDVQLFLRAVGNETDIVQKEIYQFSDKSQRLLALRPEGTAGIVRAVIENKLYQPKKTLKYFYIGSMFRYERPQKGRQREFNQFGIETMGIKSPFIDAEVIMMALEMMQSLDINNLTLHLNYFGSDETKIKYQQALKIQLLKQIDILCFNCANKININPLRILDCKTCGKLKFNIPLLQDFLLETEKTYFTTITNILTNNNIAFEIDQSLVRGLDYYNGLIFEITTLDARIGETQNTLIGGGRYDNLHRDLGSPLVIPAIGFAIGIERLMLLAAQNPLINKNIISSLEIIVLDTDVLAMSSFLLQQLRSNNFHVNGEYNLYQDKHKSQIINKNLAQNVLFLKNKIQAQFYCYQSKKMLTWYFTCKEQLLKQIKNHLLEECL